ncbi:MAG: hypothetical protein ABIP93_03755 [Gemmatimonadaceae bacterium]
MESSVRIRHLTIAGLSALALLSACQDARIKEVDTGMTRDQLLNTIGKDAPPGIDSLPNVYQRDRYLINGKNYEVFYFSESGKHAYTGVQKDTIPWKDPTPIAMIDNKVVGKGWEFLDSLSSANKIPLKKR